ncbi:uncharacterized protein LOC134215752 [Armigeres subalbatus]|uniref:uncharacterized protein LOC134215752 n=1 Tax=Armigeres subalbatus TaxID=124917 RepID=UPI002ED07C08
MRTMTKSSEATFFPTCLEIILLLMWTIVSSQAQKLAIRNLQNDPLLLIKESACKIQIGTIKIIHPINLTSIEEAAEILVRSSHQNNVNTNPLISTLKYKTKKLYANLYQLKPQGHRRSRRWNSIGTVWKWIAGTPDASDLQAINTTMNDLIDQNNQQFRINQNINDRIQQLTHAIKDITTQANLNDLMMNDVEIITSILNVDILNNMLEDIQDAVMLSKMSITSNKILSIREILIIKGLLHDQGVNIDLPDEALHANAVIITNPLYITGTIVKKAATSGTRSLPSLSVQGRRQRQERRRLYKVAALSTQPTPPFRKSPSVHKRRRLFQAAATTNNQQTTTGHQPKVYPSVSDVLRAR